MSVSQQFLVCDNTSAANFKAWGQAVSAFLLAAGWSQTPDTGQLDWTTNPAVPAGGSYLYQIWKPGDALQTGATQYFLRLEFGTRMVTSVPQPSITITLGTGTDGAGVLTGFTTAPSIIDCSAAYAINAGSVAYECDFSGDSGRMMILMWRTHPLQGGTSWFAVERTLATDGTGMSDGVTVFYGSRNSSGQQTLTFANGAAKQCLYWVAVMGNNSGGVPPLSNMSASVPGTPISPCFPLYGKFAFPATVVGVIAASDASDGALLPTVLYGASRTYLAIAPVTGNCVPFNSKILLRYD